MKKSFFIAVAMMGVAITPALAQEKDASGLGEVIVTGNRQSARYADQNRPVVGLRRKADSAVMLMTISSESRDETVRRQEIQTMLLSAIDKAGGAGIELVTGAFELMPVTKANYKDIPLGWGGRADTNKVDVLVKVKLDGTAAAAEKQLASFITGIPKIGRGAVDRGGGITLTIVNPDQYRDAIVALVADNARHYASMFGPDYAVQVSGVDAQIAWSQISSTDVLLHIPYRYTIVPK